MPNGHVSGQDDMAAEPGHHWAGATVYAYTRAQAIADGVLAEVPPALASQAGFRCPAQAPAVSATRTRWPGTNRPRPASRRRPARTRSGGCGTC
jgi:hypothetical protein